MSESGKRSTAGRAQWAEKTLDATGPQLRLAAAGVLSIVKQSFDANQSARILPGVLALLERLADDAEAWDRGTPLLAADDAS